MPRVRLLLLTVASVGALTCAIAPAAGAAAGNQTISYPDFSSTSGLQLNGFAKQDSGGTQLQLTDGGTSEASSAFSTTSVPTSGAIHTSFEFQQSGGSTAADGMTFTLQSVGTHALGAQGGALGFGCGDLVSGCTPTSTNSIDPGVAVEFDIYPNTGETNGNHVGVIVNGSMSEAQSVQPSFPLLNSGPVYAWVDYNPSTTDLDVYVSQTSTKPAVPLLTQTENLSSILGPTAYAGFTAGTGGITSIQDVLSWNLNFSGTVTSLSAQPNPASIGKVVTYTATVSPAPDGGTVDFTDGGKSISPECDAAAVDTNPGDSMYGEAFCNVVYSEAGRHSITATYSGDASYDTSSTASPLIEIVRPYATATSLSASSRPARVGKPVTFTAEVNPVPDGGYVRFLAAGRPISGCGKVTVTSGKAICRASFKTPGSFTVKAVYTGDTNYASSHSNWIIEHVTRTPTQTSLSSSPNPVAVGRRVTFRASVRPVPNGGQVEFLQGGKPIFGCGNSGKVAIKSGEATCQVTYRKAGSYSVTAKYLGDAAFATSRSSALTEKVKATKR